MSRVERKSRSSCICALEKNGRIRATSAYEEFIDTYENKAKYSEVWRKASRSSVDLQSETVRSHPRHR